MLFPRVLEIEFLFAVLLEPIILSGLL